MLIIMLSDFSTHGQKVPTELGACLTDIERDSVSERVKDDVGNAMNLGMRFGLKLNLYQKGGISS